MKSDKTRKTLKRKIQNPVRAYAETRFIWFAPELLEPGWDRGIEIVFASLDAKTLTLAYYEI